MGSSRALLTTGWMWREADARQREQDASNEGGARRTSFGDRGKGFCFFFLVRNGHDPPVHPDDPLSRASCAFCARDETCDGGAGSDGLS